MTPAQVVQPRTEVVLTPVQVRQSVDRSPIAPLVTAEDCERMANAQRFADLWLVAEGLFGRLKEDGVKIIQISGPMTTGGFGNLEHNLAVYRSAVRIAYDNGRTAHAHGPRQIFNVHDVLIYLRAIDRLCGMLQPSSDGYHHALLHEFFGPMLNPRFIDELWILPGSQTSTVARFEVDRCMQNNVPVNTYPILWYLDACTEHKLEPLASVT